MADRMTQLPNGDIKLPNGKVIPRTDADGNENPAWTVANRALQTQQAQELANESGVGRQPAAAPAASPAATPAGSTKTVQQSLDTADALAADLKAREAAEQQWQATSARTGGAAAPPAAPPAATASPTPVRFENEQKLFKYASGGGLAGQAAKGTLKDRFNRMQPADKAEFLKTIGIDEQRLRGLIGQ